MNSTKNYTLPFLLCILVSIGCSSPLIKTDPGKITDSTTFTITCNANKGNKGLKDFKGPVYVHLGLITDSSEHVNDWRYVKFKWGSEEAEALATPKGGSRWSYTIPGIRNFFGVSEPEQIQSLMVLFREGGCFDTLCHVLRNEDKTDMQILLKQQ